MRYLLGSHFWGLNVEGSDQDFMEFSFPTKEELFAGKFESTQTKTEDGDDLCLKDYRLLLKELKKGSLRGFEALYSVGENDGDSPREKELLKFAFDNRDSLLKELNAELKKSCYGEMLSKFKKAKSKEKNFKALANLHKLHFLVTSKENPFKTWSNEEALRVRLGEVESYESSLENFGKLLEDLKGVEFKKEQSKPTLEKFESLLLKLVFKF